MFKLKVVTIVSMIVNIYGLLCFSICVMFTGDLTLPCNCSFLIDIVKHSKQR